MYSVVNSVMKTDSQCVIYGHRLALITFYCRRLFEKNNARPFVLLNSAMQEWALIAKKEEHDRL